ncbi:hypothetical protein ES702_00572 [subsurface metagenome]
MSDLSLEERVTRLEELFKLHWGILDIEKQKNDLKELHQEMNRVKEELDASEKKWDKYKQSELHQEFLKLSQKLSKLSRDTHERRLEK